MFKEHEKFWAFTVLILSIVVLSMLAMDAELPIVGKLTQAGMDANQTIMNTRLRIVDAAIVGLVGIAGAAAQSLFHRSETAGQMNDILKSTIEGLKSSRPMHLDPRDIVFTPDGAGTEGAVEAAEEVAEAAQTKADAIAAGVQATPARFANDPWNQ
jgi:hypothetical protein